jgi:hypothetical protein
VQAPQTPTKKAFYMLSSGCNLTQPMRLCPKGHHPDATLPTCPEPSPCCLLCNTNKYTHEVAASRCSPGHVSRTKGGAYTCTCGRVSRPHCRPASPLHTQKLPARAGAAASQQAAVYATCPSPGNGCHTPAQTGQRLTTARSCPMQSMLRDNARPHAAATHARNCTGTRGPTARAAG